MNYISITRVNHTEEKISKINTADTITARPIRHRKQSNIICSPFCASNLKCMSEGIIIIKGKQIKNPINIDIFLIFGPISMARINVITNKIVLSKFFITTRLKLSDSKLFKNLSTILIEGSIEK